MTQHLNATEIRRTLDLLFDPEQVIELRVLVSKKQTDAGYFTDRERLIKAALAYDGKAPQYVVANAIDPRLLARYNNRIERYASATTTDDQVTARRWLPIDFDPDRPTGIPASDAEHAEAHQRAQDCRAWLAGYGWPTPIYADSGNGAWLLYRLPDLQNTPEWTAKIKRCLAIVSLLYQGRQTDDGVAVKVDQTIFNAARIVRLFGTDNLKGDGDTANGRTNRASRIVEAPDPVPVLTGAVIDRLLGAFPQEQPDARRNGHPLNGAAWDHARVEAFIDQHHLQVAYDSAYETGHKWVLAECPFNAAHTDKSAVIILHSIGRLGFRCHHNGCNGNDWKALRAMLEPGYTQHGIQVDTSRRRNGTRPDEEPPHPAIDADAAADTVVDELEEQRPIVPLSSFPELPEPAHIDEEIGADACPWLDEYITFSRRWSPRSYDDFHEACALWLLSTVAARRVQLSLGGARFTNLYIVLCARTSLWAKSTAAKIAIETIRIAGLGHLLAPDDATPQAFIDRLVAKAPGRWGTLSPSEQEALKKRLGFAGQRGWFFEEFGEKLAAMMRDGSVMADYRGHFRRFDDCQDTFSYATISRGMNEVERPYLALLANMTPSDMAPFARKGSSLWGDGFFARYAFVTPPASAERSRSRFPDGERFIPPSLSRPLRAWHEQLGTPDVEVAERLDDKGKATGDYSLNITPVEPQRCTLGVGVFDAYYRYLDALTDLVDTSDNTDLDGSYTRYAEKALRVAMLLASFSNGGRIEMAHWARGQQIAERWRRSLHHLIGQLGQSEDTPDRVREDKISGALTRHGALTAREVGQFAHISTGEAMSALEQLARAGDVVVQAPPPGKRRKRYALVQTNRSNRSSVATVAPSPNCYASIPESGPQEGDQRTVANEDSCYAVTHATVATLPAGGMPSKEGIASQDDIPCADTPSHQDQAQAHQARVVLHSGDVDRARSYADFIRNTDLRAELDAEIESHVAHQEAV